MTERTYNRDFIDQANSNAKEAVSAFAQKANGAINDLNQTMHNAGENAREWLETTRTRSKEAYQQAEQQITAHPVSAVAIAFGVGVVTALLLKRS